MQQNARRQDESVTSEQLLSHVLRLAPRPKSLAETGLPPHLIHELILKHLFDGGVLTLGSLTRRMALSGSLLEEALAFLRAEGGIEVRGKVAEGSGLRYALTDGGRANALEAMMRSGYLGPAPVPLAHYTQVARAQSIRNLRASRARMHEAFNDEVIDLAVLDQLGPAVNSGRAIFVYGPAGTGKTYITRRLVRILDDAVLIPHAIAVGNTVIRVFDPTTHQSIAGIEPGLMLDQGHDPRFVACRRPVVMTGGELTADMLEVQFDVARREYRAPVHLLATNGMFIIDDLGRQRVAPQVVLNRWIVPMEEGYDHLALNNGQHFSVLFDLVLVFSTNLDPHELADDAFLRRIGYKIRFQALGRSAYRAIWRQVCEERGVMFDPKLCDFVIDELHVPYSTPLLPCHPRDLIGIALDRAEYLGETDVMSAEALRWAWNNYFVDPN